MPEQDYRPSYYRRTIKGVDIDVYDIAEAFGLPFCQANALKYLLRAGNKENEAKGKDLQKAIESLRRAMGYIPESNT